MIVLCSDVNLHDEKRQTRQFLFRVLSGSKVCQSRHSFTIFTSHATEMAEFTTSAFVITVVVFTSPTTDPIICSENVSGAGALLGFMEGRGWGGVGEVEAPPPRDGQDVSKKASTRFPQTGSSS